jgi:DNA-binding GntR family transcriptional regulator
MGIAAASTGCPAVITASALADLPCPFARADELIRVQAMTARTACEQMTPLALQAWHDSVERASRLPTRPGWEAKAAAHAEIFFLLASTAGNQATDGQHTWAALIRDLMLTVGPGANGMITSSRQRLLACLRAGDADEAALEMENHLRALHFMWRLAVRFD